MLCTLSSHMNILKNYLLYILRSIVRKELEYRNRWITYIRFISIKYKIKAQLGYIAKAYTYLFMHRLFGTTVQPNQRCTSTTSVNVNVCARSVFLPSLVLFGRN